MLVMDRRAHGGDWKACEVYHLICFTDPSAEQCPAQSRFFSETTFPREFKTKRQCDFLLIRHRPQGSNEDLGQMDDSEQILARVCMRSEIKFCKKCFLWRQRRIFFLWKP
ncbi:hypothetical protein CFBP4996_22430 [Agrobacterium leguminum]|uniref:hypothetical protein n=1 Tax=Agrobacterium TaxID=357 RepID=UPI0010C95C3C|nr:MULTISPECIES: hypothetical protein [Agrobacterium]WFS68747.1 hypothetical protein CFBP4996_22430 [Agrobacterium leguminum]